MGLSYYGTLNEKYSDSGSESEDNEDSEKRKSGKYVAPKLRAVHYDEEPKDKEQKALEYAQKKALKTSVIREFKKDGDQPEEEETNILYQTGKMSARQLADKKHRDTFEEANFTRVRVKKECSNFFHHIKKS